MVVGLSEYCYNYPGKQWCYSESVYAAPRGAEAPRGEWCFWAPLGDLEGDPLAGWEVTRLVADEQVLSCLEVECPATGLASGDVCDLASRADLVLVHPGRVALPAHGQLVGRQVGLDDDQLVLHLANIGNGEGHLAGRDARSAELDVILAEFSRDDGLHWAPGPRLSTSRENARNHHQRGESDRAGKFPDDSSDHVVLCHVSHCLAGPRMEIEAEGPLTW